MTGAYTTLTWQDIFVLQAVRDRLKSVVEFMSSERYMTISSLLPLLHLTKDALKQKETDLKMTAEIKWGILEQLDSKYDNPSVNAHSHLP